MPRFGDFEKNSRNRTIGRHTNQCRHRFLSAPPNSASPRATTQRQILRAFATSRATPTNHTPSTTPTSSVGVTASGEFSLFTGEVRGNKHMTIPTPATNPISIA